MAAQSPTPPLSNCPRPRSAAREGKGEGLACLAGLGLALLVLGSCNPIQPIEDEDPVVAHVDLALQLAPGVFIDSVSYEISGDALAPPITGTVNVTDPGASISLAFRGIPPGTGYTIELNALSTDGGTSCAGSAPFNILPGSITEIMMTMQCRRLQEPGTGGIIVEATTNNCPVVSMAIGPISVAVGQLISMTASATDLDPNTTLSYAWTTTGGGSFANPTGTSTTFACTPAGSQTIRVTVTDGQCSRFQQIAVSCAGISIGPVQ